MKLKTIGAIALGCISVGAGIAIACMVNVSAGEYVRYQKASGEYEWFTSSGIRFVQPFISTLETYQETTTVAFSSSEDTRDSASVAEEPALVKFADGYTGRGNFTFRFKLSPDPEILEKMHIAVKGQDNLQGNTLLVAADELLNQTANQFTGSGYSQGGKGQFKSRLVDQAKNGMLSVKRIRQEVESIVADQATDGTRKQNATTKAYEYVMEVQTDANNQPIRTPLDISQFGIRIAQVTMGDFAESPELSDFLSDRRKQERQRKERIDAQNVERENAITEALVGETNRVKAQNKANMVKDAAVIKAQQGKELARIQAEREVIEREKVAELAKIDKARELQIAQDNEGIQKANASAAKYEAQAIREKGIAEADVSKAKYAALGANKDIYLAEIQRDISQVMYQSLENFDVQMPINYVDGSNGAGDMKSNLDVITGFGALGMMNQSVGLKNQHNLN